MSAKHTRGRMVVNPIQLDQIATADASKGIAHVTHFGHSVDTVIANARRLAACWNACNGVSTEHLEDDAVRKLIQDRDLLLAQRDELLEALQDYDDAFTGFDPSSKESRHRMRLAVIKARAAIAKAIGDTK